MARPPYSLNSYVGAANAATIAGSGWGAADTTISITGTNTPWTTLGTTGGFYFAAAYGTAGEEKIYVPSGNYTYANNGATYTGVTRGLDGTTALAQASGLLCTPVITSIDTSEANKLVNLYLGNMQVRSATGVMSPGEITVASGSAALTLSMPSGILVNGTSNIVSNYTSNTVTLTSGSTAQLNTFGVLGNNTIISGETYTYTYASTSNTWYCTNSNDITALYGVGTANQVLTTPGVGTIEPYWSSVLTNVVLSGTINISGTTNTHYGTNNIIGATTLISGTTFTAAGTTVSISGTTNNIYGTTNDLGTLVASTLSVSGTMTISGSTAPTYAFPPTYLSPYKSWNVDPLLATSTQTLITGTAYYSAIWVPQPCVISGISFYASTFAATDTAYLGLFAASNNQQVAVCSGVVGGTTGLIKALVSGGTYAITTPGLYYVGLVVSGSTSFVAYGPTTGQAALINMNIGTQTNVLTGLRNGSVVIGQRALYSNGTTVSGTINTSTLVPFFALS